MDETERPRGEIPKFAETVRCAIVRKDGYVLLAQNLRGTISTDQYRFPGGQMEIATGKSTHDEQVAAVDDEVRKMTGLDVSGFRHDKAGDYDVQFSGKRELLRRRVHLYKIDVPESFGAGIPVDDLSAESVQVSGQKDRLVWVSFENLYALREKKALADNSAKFEMALPPDAVRAHAPAIQLIISRIRNFRR